MSLGVALATPALAQTGGGYDLTWNSIGSGGEMCSTDGAWELTGAIGQPDARKMSGGEFELTGGFWSDAAPSQLEPPVLAPPPNEILKNRYISIDPRGANGLNSGLDLDIRITLTNTEVNGVTAEGSQWWADAPDANCISIVGSTPPSVPPNWDACPTLHLTGCPIIPTSTYDIVAIDVDTVSDPPLVAQTQLRPQDDKWWGDAVGFFTGTEWTGPQGTTNFDDVNAALRTFIDPGALNATHTSVTDIHPNRPDLGGNSVHPNRLVSIDDVFQFIKAFQGAEYPGAAIDLCP